MSDFRIGIVGAGPVGLTAALLLADRGYAPVVFERRASRCELPQAHVVNVRSNEIFHELGIFDALAQAAAPEELMLYATWSGALAGPRFGRLPVEGNAEQRAHRRAASPVRVLNVGQDQVERVLRERATALGIDLCERHDVRDARIDGGKAVLTVRGADGSETTEVFDAVLACDGAGSTVRRALGIDMAGPASLARFASCYFKADLAPYIGADTGPVHFIAGEDARGTIIAFDLKTTWALMCVLPEGATRDDFTPEVMTELVKRAVGDPKLALEVMSVGAWNMSAQVATDFRRGPFFLVGDAAHRFPPSGGLGLNTGVQDAHNLAWKLDLVARGKAGSALLDSYAAERKPIAVRNSAHSIRNLMQMRAVDEVVGAPFNAPVDPTVVQRAPTPMRDFGVGGDSAAAVGKRQQIQAAIDAQRPHFDALRVEIGFRYGQQGGHDDYDYDPQLRPGSILPHQWVAPGRSTRDLVRRDGLTLLVGQAAASGWEAQRSRVADAGIAVEALDAGASPFDPHDAMLVRPDCHVAWHHRGAADAAVVAALLGAAADVLAGVVPSYPPDPPDHEDNAMQTQTRPAAPATRTGPARPAKLAHIVLRSNERFEDVAAWYRDLLNAQVVHKDEMSCFMTYDDEHHRLAVVRVPGMTPRPSGTVGLEHFAFTYATLADLLDTYERLKSKGTLPILTINHGATTSIYYQDPDRNRVEIQVDNFDDFQQFVEFMMTGAMARNPIGVRFDADDMLAQLRAGTPAKTLQAYPADAGPVEPAVMETLNRN